jgi:hypothetical protein
MKLMRQPKSFGSAFKTHNKYQHLSDGFLLLNEAELCCPTGSAATSDAFGT